MTVGDFETRLFVRVALAGYWLGLLFRFGPWPRLTLARAIWFLGSVCLIIHVILAFHFTHHWNHTAAIEDTARQTQETIGIDWGGGIYINHLFCLMWLVDACWWLVSPANYQQRTKKIELLLQLWWIFIWFNATAIFGKGWVQPVGYLLFVGVAWLLYRHYRPRG